MNIKKYFKSIEKHFNLISVCVAALLLLIGAELPLPSFAEDSRLDILKVEIGQANPADSTKEPVADFYLNGGEEIGVRPSMVLDVYRDQFVSNTAGDNILINVLVGQVKVLKTYKDIAVARIESLTSVDTTPVLQYRTVMLGDYAVLKGSMEFPPGDGVTVPAEVLFSLNSWKLKAEAKELLGRIYEHYNKDDDKRLVVEGHTCSLGSEEYNLELSAKRAQSVREYILKAKGLSPDRITIESYGEKKPIASNETNEGRSKNRRVHIRFLPLSK